MNHTCSDRTIIVEGKYGGTRLDLFLAAHCSDLSRSHIQTLISEGHVSVDGCNVRPAYRVSVGQSAKVAVVKSLPSPLKPEDIPLDVVYEDDDLIAVNKPAGLVVHPAPGHRSGTLVNAVLARNPDIEGIGDTLRPGIVHRLDKNTSGLIIIAKNQVSHARISRQFTQRIVYKQYIALVHGCPDSEEAVIDGPIGRHPRDRKRMAPVSAGKEASTRYRVIKKYGDYSLLEVLPVTGRTHQIRVHLASAGHPVVGDDTYGKRHPDFNRHFLHAKMLGFEHPSTRHRLELTAELTRELQGFLEVIRLGSR